MLLKDRLEKWKQCRKKFNFKELVDELHNISILSQIEHTKEIKEDWEKQVHGYIEELDYHSGYLSDLYEQSLENLKQYVFVNIDTSDLDILYKYSPRAYKTLFKDLVQSFIQVFNKIDMLMQYYRETNKLFDSENEMNSYYSFYENYILQIENLLENITKSTYLDITEKESLYGNLISKEIICIDYFCHDSKLILGNGIKNYCLEKELLEIYSQRREQLRNTYQRLINLKIIPFPNSQDLVLIRTGEINLKKQRQIDYYIKPIL